MPPVTQALIIANVAVFLLQTATDLPLIEWFALWPASSGLEAGPGFEPWQLISYSFLHGGVTHILFNMFALYMFGGEIERLFGSRFYLAYYFACVLSAAVTHLIVTGWMGGTPYPTVGASGGIYGLLLAFGLYFPDRRVILLFRRFPCQRGPLSLASRPWSCFSASPERPPGSPISPIWEACWAAGC